MVTLSVPARVQRTIAGGLVLLALLTAAFAWLRWGVAERAMRRGGSIPALGFGAVMVLVIAVVAAVLVLSWA